MKVVRSGARVMTTLKLKRIRHVEGWRCTFTVPTLEHCEFCRGQVHFMVWCLSMLSPKGGKYVFAER
jgi:hypothetical protein